tara:strand:+ start:9458 stop:10681 length:1224 start_codon:yes stop_codon:yes gene_type:complete
MTKSLKDYDGDINFFEIFDILLSAKWKIINTTIAFTLVGFFLFYNHKHEFNVSTPLKGGNPSVFIEYANINDLLEKNFLSEEPLETSINEILKSSSVNSENILDLFVSEFNDYEEMIIVLQNDKEINKSIENLDDKNKNEKLFSLAKKFQIVQISESKKNDHASMQIEFEWHDIENGKNLFNQAIELSLLNVKKRLVANIINLTNFIDAKINNEIDILNNELNTLIEIQMIRDDARKQFLIEQAQIAKKLGIEKNTVNNPTFSSTTPSSTTIQSQPNNVTLNIAPNDIPYYLLGYRAIEEELSIIENLEPSDRVLHLENYVSHKEKLMILNNDISSKQLRNAAQLFEVDETKDWIVFDFSLAKHESNERSFNFIIMFIIFGVIIGSTFAIVQNFYNNYKQSNYEKHS